MSRLGITLRQDTKSHKQKSKLYHLPPENVYLDRPGTELEAFSMLAKHVLLVPLSAFGAPYCTNLLPHLTIALSVGIMSPLTGSGSPSQTKAFHIPFHLENLFIGDARIESTSFCTFFCSTGSTKALTVGFVSQKSVESLRREASSNRPVCFLPTSSVVAFGSWGGCASNLIGPLLPSYDEQGMQPIATHPSVPRVH